MWSVGMLYLFIDLLLFHFLWVFRTIVRWWSFDGVCFLADLKLAVTFSNPLGLFQVHQLQLVSPSSSCFTVLFLFCFFGSLARSKNLLIFLLSFIFTWWWQVLFFILINIRSSLLTGIKWSVFTARSQSFMLLII